MRSMESTQGILDFAKYQEVIKIALPAGDGSQGLENPFIKYPEKISQVRGFIYACTIGGKNTDNFSDDDFLASITRFAIDSPVPSISSRCALYGNPSDII